MKYETPSIEIVMFEAGEIITVSVEGEGSGDDKEGPW